MSVASVPVGTVASLERLAGLYGEVLQRRAASDGVMDELGLLLRLLTVRPCGGALLLGGGGGGDGDDGERSGAGAARRQPALGALGVVRGPETLLLARRLTSCRTCAHSLHEELPVLLKTFMKKHFSFSIKI